MERNKNFLVVDDDPYIIKSLKRQFQHLDYHFFTANSGLEAMAIMDQHDIGVIMSDMNMPGIDGFSLCACIKKKKPDIVQIILTGNPSLNNAIDAINRLQLFGYFTKPWNNDELNHVISRAFDYHHLIVENKHLQALTQDQNVRLKKINVSLEEKVRERTFLLEEALTAGILMLAKAAEEKDQETGDHINRIMTLTSELCHTLDLSPEESAQIASFSRIHDVGKIHIPDHILNKPGKLDEKEWDIMKHHTLAGERIISNLSFYRIAREIARSHHENWDGSGYPDGLSGLDIPVSARIVSVADVYDALTHKRPYKKAWSKEDALSEMKNMGGKKFDTAILNAFLEKVCCENF
ncbi:MAG: response regulator [Proteobacteria bacterium]|nr:response regulator [Pseudomonadota bacterium]